MKVSILIARFLFCVLVLASPFSAQLPGSDKTDTSDQVKLRIFVTDSEGRIVQSVGKQDLSVFVKGKQIPEFSLTRSSSPLKYILAVDNSGSGRKGLEDVIAGAKIIVNSNKPEDTTRLIRFIDSEQIEAVTGYTSDLKELTEGLDSLYVALGSTALLDALHLSVDDLATNYVDSIAYQKYVVVISDGEDRDSVYKFREVSTLLKEKNVRVVFIGFVDSIEGKIDSGVSPKKRQKKARELIERVVEESRGVAIFLKKASDLSTIADGILPGLREQTYLEFELPPKTSAEKIEVKLSSEWLQKGYRVFSSLE